MKTTLFLTFCLSLFYLHGQSLQRYNNQHLYNEASLNRKEVLALYKKSPQALAHFKKAERKRYLSLFFVTPGALVAGYELGRWTGGGKYSWQRMAAGLGAMGIGVLLSKNMEKEYQAAVDSYNQQQKKQTSWKLNVIPHSQGIALRFQF